MNLDGLRLYADGLPAGALVSVPRETVLELLDCAAGPSGDLTVKQLGQRWGRAASTVRDMCKAGRIPGAYLFNRKDWRIPVASVTAYEAAQRATRDTNGPATTTPPRTPNLGAWRQVG